MADSGARGSTQQIRQLAAHARSHGQAVGRNHRDPHHRELPRRSLRAAVLHLDARRPQGSRRHRPQDGQLRYLTRRLVDVAQDAVISEYDCGTLDGIRVAKLEEARRSHPAARRPHPRPRGARRRRRPAHRRSARQSQHRARRGHGQADRGSGHRRGRHPLGAHLPDQARRVRAVLRPRSRARLPGQHRRGGRHHRRPVDRRAGHAAHDAHVPHRRRRGARQDRAELARSAHRGLRPAAQRRSRQATRRHGRSS